MNATTAAKLFGVSRVTFINLMNKGALEGVSSIVVNGITRYQMETIAVCDKCWDERNPNRKPVRIKEADEEICTFCQDKTVSGIYQRLNQDGNFRKKSN